MIATAIEKKDLISEIGGAPKVITSDAQHERYVSALLELERGRQGRLNAAGRALAEFLTAWLSSMKKSIMRFFPLLR